MWCSIPWPGLYPGCISIPSLHDHTGDSSRITQGRCISCMKANIQCIMHLQNCFLNDCSPNYRTIKTGRLPLKIALQHDRNRLPLPLPDGSPAHRAIPSQWRRCEPRGPANHVLACPEIGLGINRPCPTPRIHYVVTFTNLYSHRALIFHYNFASIKSRTKKMRWYFWVYPSYDFFIHKKSTDLTRFICIRRTRFTDLEIIFSKGIIAEIYSSKPDRQRWMRWKNYPR